MTGWIKNIRCDAGYGFIGRDDHGPDVFFHVSQLDTSVPFDDSLRERRVEFELIDSPKGPRAKAIRPAD